MRIIGGWAQLALLVSAWMVVANETSHASTGIISDYRSNNFLKNCCPGNSKKFGSPRLESLDRREETDSSAAETLPDVQDVPPVPPVDVFSQAPESGMGASESFAPGMIGDFFSVGQFMNITTSGQGNTSSIPFGGGDRRFKIVENNNPFPTNRVFFNYHHFENAVTPASPTSLDREINLDRYTFGLERTFFGDLTSVELRMNFAHGLNATQSVVSGADNDATEMGNLAIAFKLLLYRSCNLSVSTGLGLVVPTADDAVLLGNQNVVKPPSPGLIVENEAVHLQPFLGIYMTPQPSYWLQFSCQADFDANGNTVDIISANGVGADGTLQDQNLLFLDFSLGYWLYRVPCGCCMLSGIAPVFEIHYSTTLNDTDIIDVGEDVLTNPANRLDVLNATAGLRFQIGRCSDLTIAAVAPLRDEKVHLAIGAEEKLFDAEVAVQFNRRY